MAFNWVYMRRRVVLIYTRTSRKLTPILMDLTKLSKKGVQYAHLLIYILRLPVQRKHTAVVAFIFATLSLSGCGNALKLDAGKTTTSQFPTATPDVPVAEASDNAGFGASEEPVSSVPAFAPTTDTTQVSPIPEASAAPEIPAPESSPPAEPLPSPTVNPEFAAVQFPNATERWRYVQVNRTPLAAVQTYTTPSKQLLWWYDPVFGQPVKLGEIQGDFPVQATFRFRGQEVEALEIPYQVNQSFGIALPSAIVERIRRAGGGEWVEAFVYQTDDMRAR